MKLEKGTYKNIINEDEVNVTYFDKSTVIYTKEKGVIINEELVTEFEKPVQAFKRCYRKIS